MKRSICRAAVVAGVIAFGAPATPATPALGAGFTLNLAPQSDAVVGRPMIIQATGTIPPEDVQFPYWFSLDAIPTAVTSTCPLDRWEGVQFASSNGGTVVVLSQSEHPDAAGNFSIPVAVTPSAPGSVLLCGYTDDGEAATLARASLTLNIQPGPSTLTLPRRVSPPVEAERAIRSCRALLAPSHSRGCIRRAIRQANARCSRLRSRRSRSACTRAVRRVGRKYS